MLEKKVLYNYTHDTVCFGKVYNDTEEYYGSRTECFARGNELRADETIAFVLDGYDYQTGKYRVAYAYKA